MAHRNRRVVRCAAVLAFVCASAVAPSLAQTGDTYPNFDENIVCIATVEKKLADFGVPRSDVRELLAERHFSASDFGDVYLGWTVWADLKSCDGSLAIRVSEECHFMTAYTTRTCRIPGVYPSH